MTHLRFRHRRKLGDIIYSLPAIRHLGGGILYLDPTSFYGAPDQACWRRHFETLIPYLEQQPYLRDARIYQGEEFDAVDERRRDPFVQGHVGATGRLHRGLFGR